MTKAFQTRVGEGPFPTELTGKLGEQLRGSGANPWDEFGTTTGRPRRCGWLDLVLLRYAIRVNGFTEMAITKLDILTGMPSLNVCYSYEFNGKRFDELPAGLGSLGEVQPVLEQQGVWEEDITGAKALDDLPPAALAYIQRIEHATDLPVRMISVGPEREQLIIR